MRFIRAVVAAILVLAVQVPPLTAEDKAVGAAPGLLQLVPKGSVSQHALETPSGRIAYTATAGSIDLFSQDGAIRARMFYTAYTSGTAEDRPLTFVFNGGPGAASAYLHMGFVGPRIVELGPGRNDGTTPELTANPDSWLAFTDLVMIDPVGTGWSRAVSGDAARGFWGVDADAESLARFISRYVQENDRLSSPKVLLGESYGGFRAAKVASELRDSQGLLVAGIVMVSPMIDGHFLSGTGSDPLTAALQLPSLAAAEMERRGAFDADAVSEAERFAMTDYLVALAGAPPTGPKADALYARVASLTGLPVETVSRARGFVGELYEKNAAGEGRVVSSYDGGQSVPDANPQATSAWQDDPILEGYTRAYSAAFTAYATHDLGVDSQMTYVLLNRETNRRWDWDEGREEARSSGDLRDLLSVIPSFRLAILHGYSDTLTPYAVSRYVLDHLPASLAEGRTELRLYRGGHMFYVDPASRRAAFEDMRRFYGNSAIN